MYNSLLLVFVHVTVSSGPFATYTTLHTMAWMWRQKYGGFRSWWELFSVSKHNIASKIFFKPIASHAYKYIDTSIVSLQIFFSRLRCKKSRKQWKGWWHRWITYKNNLEVRRSFLFNRLERLEELAKTCHMRPGEKPYQQGHWEPAYTSMQEQHSRSTCWEQPSCPTSWEQPSFSTSVEKVSWPPWEQNSRSGPWEQHSRSIPQEHPSWSDAHESMEFQSLGTQNTAKTPLHKCPPLVATSKVSSKALLSSVINWDADELLPADSHWQIPPSFASLLKFLTCPCLPTMHC